jgi:hypothetical protein
MITSKEANGLLLKSIPKIATSQNGIEDAMLAFATYTRQSAQECDINRIKKCMTVAQDLYANGDAELKTLIERVYIPALKQAISRDCAEARLLQIYIPVGLYQLYVMQGFSRD